MKIAVILGRGIEGCGVTRNAIEFVRHYPNSKVFAINDKKWPRHNSLKLDAKLFNCATHAEMLAIANEINKDFEAVVVYSVPSLKHSDECVNNFVELLTLIKHPKSMIQVDHNNASIIRNARLADVCNAMDLIMTHSLHGAFAGWCEKNNVSTPLTTMGVGFDYEAHKAKWWKPIEQQQSNMVKWIGRCAMWKGPIEIVKLHNDYLRQHNFVTTLEGLEASVQSLLVTHEDGFKKSIKRDVQEYIRGRNRALARNHYNKEVPGSAPYLYPDFKNEDCMDRLSRSAFGSDLYNLKPQYYGNNIEYCHAEVIACGTVPIFHKHFGDHIIHPKTGNPATQDDTGVIWYNAQNPEETANQILNVYNNMTLRDEMRNKAFEYWKGHSDSSIVFTDIIKKVTTAKKHEKISLNLERFFS